MVNLNLENLYRRNIMTLKEQLDKFNEWHDEDYEDERGAIEYDNFDDHEAEDGYGRDEFVDGSDDLSEEEAMDAMGLNDSSVDDWWASLGASDTRTEEEKEADSAADEWLGENETVDSLTAKEAKLQEALKAVQEAKAKLAK